MLPEKTDLDARLQAAILRTKEFSHTPTTYERAKALRNNGKTYKNIGEIMGISSGRIYRILNKKAHELSINTSFWDYINPKWKNKTSFRDYLRFKKKKPNI